MERVIQIIMALLQLGPLVLQVIREVEAQIGAGKGAEKKAAAMAKLKPAVSAIAPGVAGELMPLVSAEVDKRVGLLNQVAGHEAWTPRVADAGPGKAPQE